MNEFLSKVEVSLIPYAQQFTPTGTDPKAVIHQWAHAIANKNNLFAEEAGANKDKIVELLKQQSLYISISQFKKMLYEGIIFTPSKLPKFSFIDLFAGIGGMRLGAQLEGGTCVFSSEFDSFAQNTYYSNFNEIPFGDIKNIDAKLVPNHDVLMAGFPCQPFSYAGKSKGFEDKTRGTLFFDVLRIIEEKKPKIVFLENVKGFKSHEKGETMDIALKALEEAGYYPNWTILNSYHFGVPQFRERWYCIATPKPLNFNFPTGDSKKTTLRDIVSLTENDPSLNLNKFERERIKFHFESNEIRVQHDNSLYAPNTKKGKHGVYSFQKPDGALRFHVGDFAKTQIQEAFYACLDTYAPTIIANRVPKLWDIGRKLSVIEALKLQGFPDQFKFNVSKGQAYKQLGNSVTVPVIQELIKSILVELEK